MKLSLAMIVKDEEEILERCLLSLPPIFDEKVIIDTGSTDKTKEIATRHGCRIFDFKWVEDFSAARNFCFGKATGDYIMWLDADDIITEENQRKLVELKKKLGSHDAYLMAYDYCQDEYGNSILTLQRHRIIRSDIRWRYPIHECLQVQGRSALTTDITITHRRTAKAATQDQGRNIRIFRKAMDKGDCWDGRMKYYYAKELFDAGENDETIQIFEDYLKAPDWHENAVGALIRLAFAHFRKGNEDAVLDTCFRGLKLDPRWAEFYGTIGQVYYNRQDWPKAIAWFEIVKTIPVPETWGSVFMDYYTWVPHDRLCFAYSVTGKIREAYEENEKALKHRPNDERFLNNRKYLRDILFPGRSRKQPIRLNLGASSKPVPTFKNCDLYPQPAVEEVFGQGDIPYEDGTVHAIYSEHALEHSDTHESARRTLKEWARVLRHNAPLTLKLPDLDRCCDAFVKAEDRSKNANERFSPKDWYRYTIYGTHENAGQFHRTGFTKKELERILPEAGFEVQSIKEYDGWDTPSLHVEALQKKHIKVRWCVPGDDLRAASTRIRRVNVSSYLKSQGFDSEVCGLYSTGERDRAKLFEDLHSADVVVFSAFGSGEGDLMEDLNRAGVVTIFDLNEELTGYPALQQCLENAVHVVFCGTAMANTFGRHVRSTVIPDAYELPPNLDRYYQPHGTGSKVKVVWCGYGGNAENCDFLRPIIADLGMELEIISEWDNADRRWTLETWLEDLQRADVVISPQRETQGAKSNVKATQAMALGIPVIVTPIPAYQEAIREGVTGMFARTDVEWKNCLQDLAEQGRRQAMGQAARAAVKERYSIEGVGILWDNLLEALTYDNLNPPKVDIIIPTYNNLQYLQRCVEAIRRNTSWPHNIIVVNSGADGTDKWLQQQPDIIYYNSAERLHFSAANNVGIKIAAEEYVCLLNDDTIPGKGWLRALMAEAVKPEVGAVGPFSNCDQGWLHNEKIEVAGMDLHPAMKLHEVEHIIPQIGDHTHKKILLPQKWIAFYATLFPRKVINEVGFLDEDFKSGCEDRDYCYRVEAKGYRFLQTMDSWVFHFGGTARKRAENENAAQHAEEDRANNEVLQRKYSKAPQDSRPIFVLYTGPAWEPWSPDNINKGGIGGSETCAVFVAREFARRGYQAFVFGECKGLEGVYEEVTYKHWTGFDQFAKEREIEIFVSSRRPEIFSVPLKARHKITWVHDIWLAQDANTNVYPDVVDRYYVLSPWHRQFFLGHHKAVLPEKTFVTQDGINPERFQAVLPRTKGKMIYSSSPDRGLDILLHVFPRIREKAPHANLHVFYGFNNWEKAIRQRNDPTQLSWMEDIKRALKQPGVTFHGRVGQDRLAQEILTTELWGYPTFFWETFCITAAEMMAAGVPVVTSDLAALSTTVGDAGILIQGDCRQKPYQDRFVDECVKMLTIPDHWQQQSMRARQKASLYTWSNLVDGWLDEMESRGGVHRGTANA